MSTEAIIHLAQTVIMATVGAIVVLLKWGVRGGSALAEHRAVGVKVDALGLRMDTAGQETSDLSDAVQVLKPRVDRCELEIERLRPMQHTVPTLESTVAFTAHRIDRLEARIDNLKTI